MNNLFQDDSSFPLSNDTKSLSKDEKEKWIENVGRVPRKLRSRFPCITWLMLEIVLKVVPAIIGSCNMTCRS